MSLLQALAEAVVNVSASKGGARAAQPGRTGGGGLFGQQSGQSGGGIEDMLGSLLGGQAQQSGGAAQGGLGGLLEQLAGGQVGSSGGLDDIIGQLTSGGNGQSGGLGGLVGALTSALGQGGSGASAGGDSFGNMLNQTISNRGKAVAPPQPTPAQDAAAGLMLRAMIQAAKSDGKFDQSEQQKLLGRLGDVSAMERQFVNDELAKPVDVAGLARDIPRGLEHQVYAMSVLGIDLDNKNEAQYLHQLAQAVGLDQNTVNQVHAQLGAPALYG